MSRKGRTGGGGWVHPKAANSMAVSGLCGRKVIGWNWDGHVPALVLQATNASIRRPGEGRRVDGKLEGRCYEQLLCSNEKTTVWIWRVSGC